jgi:hypothetical protein
MTTLDARPRTTAPPLDLPVFDGAPSVGTAIDTYGAVDRRGPYGTQLRQVRTASAAFRTELASTGTPTSVSTHDLVSLPYPVRFGLWRSALTPTPYLCITNRMIVVRWADGERTRTLVFEPSDYDLGEYTPYFARLGAQTPDVVERRIVTKHGTVLEHLAGLGIDPANVDYLAFDHLHTQDVRRWVGTTTPQPDLSPDAPVEPAFPNAKLLVQRTELEALRDLHPLQLAFYQPATYTHLRPGSVVAVDGDVLLGPGVALLATPGHTLGNQTLALNTSSGIWAVSENALAAECLVPEHSRIPGVRRMSERWQREVVLNSNTPEALADQYCSIVLEKSLVDVAQADPRFPQFLPSSELTPAYWAPGARPTFAHRGIQHGTSHNA